jgi:hypothetical protein
MSGFIRCFRVKALLVIADSDSGKLVPLTHGKYAIVDEEDYDRVMQYKWTFHRYRRTEILYVQGRIPGYGNMFLHRFILLPAPGMQVDHIDGNPQDNRRSNSRICTNAQNSMNSRKAKNKTSVFKGVSWNKQSRKWRATIAPKGGQIHLGLFDDPVLAAKAYDKAARLHFGEFAKLNFSDTEG